MNSHDLYSVVTTLVHSHVLDLVQLPVQSLFIAKDGGLDLANNTGLFVEDNWFDFASVDYYDAEEEHGKWYKILPPMAFTVAFEEDTVMAEGQVIY